MFYQGKDSPPKKTTNDENDLDSPKPLGNVQKEYTFQCTVADVVPFSREMMISMREAVLLGCLSRYGKETSLRSPHLLEQYHS